MALRKTSPTSPGMLRVIAVLEGSEFPMLGRELADQACVSFGYFDSHMRPVLIEAGKIHIAGWAHGFSGPMRPVYVAGPGKEAKKPPKYNLLERSRLWKVRSGYNARRKAAYRIKRAPSLLSALLGMATA